MWHEIRGKVERILFFLLKIACTTSIDWCTVAGGSGLLGALSLFARTPKQTKERQVT